MQSHSQIITGTKVNADISYQLTIKFEERNIICARV